MFSVWIYALAVFTMRDEEGLWVLLRTKLRAYLETFKCICCDSKVFSFSVPKVIQQIHGLPVTTFHFLHSRHFPCLVNPDIFRILFTDDSKGTTSVLIELISPCSISLCWHQGNLHKGTLAWLPCYWFSDWGKVRSIRPTINITSEWGFSESTQLWVAAFQGLLDSISRHQ